MKKLLFLFAVFFFLLGGTEARAQCETSAGASPAMSQLETTAKNDISDFTTQEKNFIDELVNKQAVFEVKYRIHYFEHNITDALSRWQDKFIKALKDMTKQLSVSRVDRQRMSGTVMDAQTMAETVHFKRERQVEAQQRYTPSELACQIDTAGPAQSKSYQLSRALNKAFTADDTPRRNNARGSISATGRGAEMKTLWDEYKTYFCDKAKGDQGCDGTGTLSGKQRDISGLLWGEKQTIDMSNPEDRRAVQAAMRYLIYPMAADPVPPGAVDSPGGQAAIMLRRAEEARVNAIYNTMGQMVAERAGGSGLNTQEMRKAAGIVDTDASTSASYREIQEAMTKDRFYNPAYVIQMVSRPEQVVREQGSINALRLQMMNDIYKRSEEMLFMESAAYARDLDKEVPSSAVEAVPLK